MSSVQYFKVQNSFIQKGGDLLKYLFRGLEEHDVVEMTLTVNDVRKQGGNAEIILSERVSGSVTV